MLKTDVKYCISCPKALLGKIPWDGPQPLALCGRSLIMVLLGVCISMCLCVSGEGLVQGVIWCLTVEQCS